MKIRLYSLILLMFCFFKTYSIENYKEFEDSYVQINAKNLKDDFFMVKFDSETENVYIGLNTFFYFLELYTLDINLKEKKVYGNINKKNIKVYFDDEESFVMDGELYVNIKVLEKKLLFKESFFDYSALKLNVEPNFILPYEERERAKVERLRLDTRKVEDEKKIDFEIPRKLATPGLFKIDYSKSNVEESEYQIKYEYSSQLLYGELYLSGEIKPEHKIDYGNLTYSDIIEDNDLVVGNFSLIAPSFFGVDTKVLGVSFENKDTYMTRDSGITIIKGQAKNAETIELYRNSFLVDYIKPYSENFEFRIDDGVFNSDYTLKIYYENGEIEERKVYSLSDSDLLKKGKSRFTFQGGKGDETHENQYIGRAFYGVTDNLTLGLGGMNLNSTSGNQYRILESDILLRTGNKNFPMIINYKNYYDYKSEENSYELSVDQKLFSYNLKFIENSFSETIAEQSEIKKYNSISLGKSFNRNFFEIGVERILKTEEKFGEDKEENIYGLWDSSVFNPVYTSLKIEKNINGSREDVGFKPSLSYSNGSVSILLEADISKDDGKRRYDQEYFLRINHKKENLFKEILFVDVGAEIKYSNETKKFTYGLSFNIELDDIIYMKLPSTTTFDEDKNRKTQTGLEVSKIIDLSNPKRKIKKNISLNSSWIHGKVFLDKNGNGVYDEGETPLENVKVMVDNKHFYSDKNGEYVAEGFYSNEVVVLDIDRKTLDPMLKNSRDSLKIKTRRSSGAKIDIPVEVVSLVMGNIWQTEDFSEKEFIRSISMTTILLEKDGKVVKTIDPEFDGMFFFEDVTPGEYIIKFEYIGEENIGFSQNMIPVNVTLENPEEGGYFEGIDTRLIRNQENISEKEEDSEITDDIFNF
ncbi:hypothetical protein [Fusobacterium sp.]|uniref:hypothetical protein n=1 Tax=Fusobacterium sp. TaxID=68766 RepID=UPI002619A640|nr:hypothetical protein [Fusobacterium sp.]